MPSLNITQHTYKVESCNLPPLHTPGMISIIIPLGVITPHHQSFMNDSPTKFIGFLLRCPFEEIGHNFTFGSLSVNPIVSQGLISLCLPVVLDSTFFFVGGGETALSWPVRGRFIVQAVWIDIWRIAPTLLWDQLSLVRGRARNRCFGWWIMSLNVDWVVLFYTTTIHEHVIKWFIRGGPTTLEIDLYVFSKNVSWCLGSWINLPSRRTCNSASI